MADLRTRCIARIDAAMAYDPDTELMGPHTQEPGDYLASAIAERAMVGVAPVNPMNVARASKGIAAAVHGDVDEMTEAAVEIVCGDLLALVDAVDLMLDGGGAQPNQASRPRI